MLKFTKTILALCAVAASGIVCAQTAGGGPTGMGGSEMRSGGGSSGKDPFVENREEKAQARKEFRKDKSGSKQDYKAERKAANKKLRESGAQSEGTKNIEVPSTR